MDGRVDNPVAAQDFVEEVQERKTVSGLNVLDYWATWIVAGVSALVMLQRWRRKGSDRGEA
jgi:hypothetical protein